MVGVDGWEEGLVDGLLLGLDDGLLLGLDDGLDVGWDVLPGIEGLVDSLTERVIVGLGVGDKDL